MSGEQRLEGGMGPHGPAPQKIAKQDLQTEENDDSKNLDPHKETKRNRWLTRNGAHLGSVENMQEEKLEHSAITKGRNAINVHQGHGRRNLPEEACSSQVWIMFMSVTNCKKIVKPMKDIKCGLR